MKILVTGATGRLGRRLVPLLLKAGARVRIMTRQPDGDAARALGLLGAQVVRGDLLDAASLARACTGMHRVLLGAHALLGRGRGASERVDGVGQRALIDAACAAGVRRLVLVSALGAAPDHPVDFFRTKHAIEEALRRSGLEHTILRPSAFMECHAHLFNGRQILERGFTVIMGRGNKPRNFICADDVAQFVAEALLQQYADDAVVELGGPGNHSNNQVAALYAHEAGVPLRAWHLPAAACAALAALARPAHPGVARILRLGGLADDAFSEQFDATALQQRSPQVRLTPLERFVHDQVQAWRSARAAATLAR